MKRCLKIEAAGRKVIEGSEKEGRKLWRGWILTVDAEYKRSLRAYRKKRAFPDLLKITTNCIKTIDYSISVDILMLHSCINAFTYSWYVSNTYHSPVNVHVIATYYIRSTPVHWSRFGRNCYETDTRLPSSFSRSEYLFRTRSVAADLVKSLEFQPIRCVNMKCRFHKHGTVR